MRCNWRVEEGKAVVELRAQIQLDDQPVADERSDEELVRLSLSEPTAFAHLYRRYVNAVYQYCDRCLGNLDDAEEATQTVFLRVLSSLGQCRVPAGFRPWLFAIAHNVIVDTYRRRKATVELDSQLDTSSPERSIEDQVLASLQRREITSLLANLPDDQREVIELRLQGLSAREIAGATGKTSGSVRTAQYRAVRRLRTVIASSAREMEHVAH